MTVKDRHILSLFAARVREIAPEAKVWAFGSRARGNADPDSDFDLCVVLNECTEDMEARITHIAWEVGFENDILITTVVYAIDDFEKGLSSFSPLVRSVRKDGVIF